LALTRALVRRVTLDRVLTFETNVARSPAPAAGASDAGGVACSTLLGSLSSGTLALMTIKATVKAGRLVVDEPTNLPDGTEVELLPLDPGDWLSVLKT